LGRFSSISSVDVRRGVFGEDVSSSSDVAVAVVVISVGNPLPVRGDDVDDFSVAVVRIISQHDDNNDNFNKTMTERGNVDDRVLMVLL
jgi:hypothetical protein